MDFTFLENHPVYTRTTIAKQGKIEDIFLNKEGKLSDKGKRIIERAMKFTRYGQVAMIIIMFVGKILKMVKLKII